MRVLAPLLIAGVALVSFFIGRSMHHTATPAALSDEGAQEQRPPSALPKSNASAFNADWLLTIGTADQNGVLAASTWHELLSSARLDPELSARIVARWAKRDPLACWEHILTLGDGVLPPDHLAMAAVKAFAIADPERAMRELSEANVPLRFEIRGKLVWKALRAILAVDLEKGMALAPLAPQSAFTYGSREAWMVDDPAKACRLLATLPAGHTFRNTIGAAAKEWFEIDADATMAWVATLPQEDRGEALEDIAEHLKHIDDLEGVEQLALSTESMRLRREIAKPYLRQLCKEDPIAACDWIAENFVGESLGQAMAQNLRFIDNKAHPPEGFVPYVEQIPEGMGKGQAVAVLITPWLEQDGVAAANWLSTLSRDTVEWCDGHSRIRTWVVTEEGRQWMETAEESPFLKKALRAQREADE